MFGHLEEQRAKDIEDVTCPRVDVNFIFECSTRYIYLTSERSEGVRYLELDTRIHIHKRACNILFIISINTSEKGAIYYVTTTIVISSRVKITWLFSLVN